MRISKMLFISLMAVLTTSLAGCFKLDNSHSYEEEQKQLQDYLAQQNITTKPNDLGLYYVEQTAGTGKRANLADTLVIKYVGRLFDGTIFDQTSEGATFKFIEGKGQVISGLEQGVLKMKQGGKARLIIPSALAYGYSGYGKIPPYTALVMDIELVSVGTTVTPYDITGLVAKTTDSGIKYYIVRAGTGKQVPELGNVTVKFTGYIDDGTIIETTYLVVGDYSISINKEKLIAGLYEGFKLMKEGDKYRFIIPSALGYGTNGVKGIVPSGAILTYDAEIVKVN